ncbi:hypothetical protein DPMN_093524 [Dreissena polymorpha]|uniref:Uncharacterized protein n=1 Tax=Dreissena polymorpha TaxID=45954 RepID=A0A9D4L3Q2_DREPO|nr:hypothetical protein DPMN_093524 [Dreissena polymorpha]
MASIDATSRRPDPQNGFPTTMSVLSTAVMGHVHYLQRANPQNPGMYLCPWSAPSALYLATSAASVPLETTIHLRTITIPLGQPSKFSGSTKSAGEDVQVENLRYSLD